MRIDPLLPPGEKITPVAMPAMPAERCSLTAPVCVHGEKREELHAAVLLLEDALQTLTVAWGLPNPWGLSAGPRGLHWVLTDRPLEIEQRRAAGFGFDRAEGFCVGGPRNRDSALRCVTEASVAALAPATASWLRMGFGISVAESVAASGFPAPCVVAAQNSPHEGILEPTQDGRSSLFFDFLQRFSPPQSPLAAPLALILVSGTHTLPGASRWDAEPDLLDALRVNMDGDRNRFARFMDDFALYRWTLGATDPGIGVTVDWELDRTSLPRTLVSPHPLAPGGSTYLRLDLQNPPVGRLAVRTYCEPPVSYVWSLAVLDSQGQVERHIPISFREQSPQAEALIGELQSAAAILVVGTNLGGVDLAHPFDPDHAPHERHSCQVTFNWLEASVASSHRATP